ncbi:pituitary tumor-transforming gene 1 protein-interacting protein-like [Pristis pectinata]|uniref:pituitary tumor-transforming gene 1 protein-interacting protein-like n=1 Tax=Pristis pectinata TaxID=685728 RepID=UPI00223CF61E|nr:pituitary tumor-transforming gene 1 protein-interacting protein-like [Pristis pectinata]
MWRVRAALVVGFLTSLSLPGCSPDPTGKDCSDFSYTSCEECLENIDCLWCFVEERCMKYPVEFIIPPSSICPLHEARWAVCWVNFESLIIAMSIVGGLILLPLVCCCCYCCCKFKLCCCQKKSHCPDEEEVRLARQQEERRQRNEQRKSDRSARYDEIRKKYGLIQNSEPTFRRFENE